MRFLLISHAFPPDMGGASNRASNLLQMLVRGGHDVQIIAGFPYYPHGQIPRKLRSKFFASSFYGKSKVLRVWMPPLRPVGLLRRLMLYVCFTLTSAFGLVVNLRTRLDAVWYVSPYSLGLFSLPSCVFGSLKKCTVLLDVADLWPEVITEVGGISSPTVERTLKLMTAIVTRVSSAVTVITESIGKRAVEFGVDSRKVHVIELGIDTELYHPISPRPVVEGFGGNFVVEYSGLFGPKYDFGTLLEAARIVGERANDVLFFIRGDGELRSEIVKRAERSSNVRVSTTIVSQGQLVEYLNSADVLVCPLVDTKEASMGIPSKVIEYLSVGKPVVCSAKGDTERIINGNAAGIVVKPGDSEALASALLKLHDDRTLCEEYGGNARSLAENEFSLESMNPKLDKLLGPRSGNLSTETPFPRVLDSHVGASAP